jgi:hypothetical protein
MANSSLNPLNYSPSELKKALYGGAVGALLVLSTVLTTSGVPQTAGGWGTLGSTLLGSFVVSAVSVFLPKNATPTPESVNEVGSGGALRFRIDAESEDPHQA